MPGFGLFIEYAARGYIVWLPPPSDLPGKLSLSFTRRSVSTQIGVSHCELPFALFTRHNPPEMSGLFVCFHSACSSHCLRFSSIFARKIFGGFLILSSYHCWHFSTVFGACSFFILKNRRIQNAPLVKTQTHQTEKQTAKTSRVES